MDLSFNMALSYRDLKDPTSRQNFEDTHGQIPKLILTLRLNLYYYLQPLLEQCCHYIFICHFPLFTLILVFNVHKRTRQWFCINCRASFSKFLQDSPNFCKFLQIPTRFFKFLQGSSLGQFDKAYRCPLNAIF